MCGIAGEIAIGRPADREAVLRMTTALRSRGPDSLGTYATGAMALGNTRLSIIDLSARANQPMVDTHLGLAIVFNGCIYNHRAIRTRLRHEGYDFFSESDTEVVLKAYHRWGLDFATHLNGMFALALADMTTGDLILCRDRLGIKPLYVSPTASAIKFASTVPAMLAGGGIDTSIDPLALYEYLSFHSVVAAPRTLLRGVRKVSPGTVVRIDSSGKVQEHRYWSVSYARHAAYAGWSREEWREGIHEQLRRSVRLQLEADVPVGVLLSGGLDSSLLVALLSEECGSSLTTFSVGFEEAAGVEGDEFEYSDLVARTFDTNHHRFLITQDGLLSAIPSAVAAMSEPMASHDAVGFYLLAERVSQEMKAVQSGQGADELFAGYEQYQAFSLCKGAGLDEYTTLFDRDRAELTAAMNPEVLPEGDPAQELAARYFGDDRPQSPVDRMLQLETEIMLVEDPLKRIDNMTMAWGVEARVPYLDHELVELAAACPPEMKLGASGKAILKEAARSVLPASLVYRRKGSFPVPAVMALEGRVADLAREILSSPCARDRGLLRREYVEDLMRSPSRTPQGDSKLWQVAVLELWLQCNRTP